MTFSDVPSHRYDGIRRLTYVYGGACCPIIQRVVGRPEFQLASNFLALVYRQALIWLGVFYSPLLPLVGVICDIIILYIKSTSLNFCLEPPIRIYRASRSE